LDTFSILHDFGTSPGTGSKPNGSLISIDSSGFLYGVSHGSNGEGGEIGTLFRLKTDGSDFSLLHRFDSVLGGNTPMRSLVYHQAAFYGISVFGGLTTDMSNPETGGGFIFRYEPVASPSTAKSTFIEWLVDNQLLINQSLVSNVDQDSLSLIEEFAFGGDPLLPDTIHPSSLVPVPGNLLQLQATAVRTEMMALVWPLSSANLIDWVPASGFTYLLTDHPTDPSAYKVLTWQWPDSFLSGNPFFLKLETTLE